MRRELGVALGCMVFALSCGKSPAPPEPAPASTAAPVPSRPSAPDHSALPLVRGVVVLTTEASRLTPCGAEAPSSLRDETGGPLAQAYGELASADTGEMWVELRAESGPQGHVAREVVRAFPMGEGNPCATLPSPGEVRALGNEPFWAVSVTAAGLELSMPDLERPLVFPAAAPVADGRKRTWTSELAGTPAHRLQLVVGPARCKDGMSGAWYGLAAEAVFDGRALTGCAMEGG